MVTLYHGTTTCFERPDLARSQMSGEVIRRHLKRSAITGLIEQVMKVEASSLPDAIRYVYESKLYEMVNDDDAWLYREGPVYLYELLKEEGRRAC